MDKNSGLGEEYMDNFFSPFSTMNYVQMHLWNIKGMKYPNRRTYFGLRLKYLIKYRNIFQINLPYLKYKVDVDAMNIVSNFLGFVKNMIMIISTIIII